MTDFRGCAAAAYGAVDVPDAVIDLLVGVRNYLQVRGRGVCVWLGVWCCVGVCRRGWAAVIDLLVGVHSQLQVRVGVCSWGCIVVWVCVGGGMG